MRAPITPNNEALRLSALHELGILDTPPEERFDRITATAKLLFDVPIALVSLVDAKRQWFKSRQGLDAFETARDVSFCGHAILSDEVFVVEDAFLDPRFADNPLVTGAPHVRFYAGAPLANPDGMKLGTLCIIDREPRAFDPRMRALLRGLGHWVERELNLVEDVSRIAARFESKLQLAAVMDNMVEGVIMISESGIVESLNPAAVRMFGYAAGEVVGHNVSMLMPEPYHSAHDGYLRHYRDSGERRIIGSGREVVGLRKNGSTFPMELAVSEIALASGRRYTGIVRDITERRRAEDALRESEERLALALEGSKLALFDWDVRTGTVQLSKEWSAILGDTPHPTTTTIDALARLVHPDDAARLQDHLRAALRGEKPFYEIEHRVSDVQGKWRWVLSRAKVVERDAAGRALRVTGTNDDVTQRIELERMKHEFVSTVSHELRTPLTSIMGSLALIVGGAVGALPDQARSLIEIAHRNTQRLVRLINDILDIDKIESGQMHFDLSDQELMPIVQQALEANRSYAEQFGVELVLARALPDARAMADSDRLNQVLTNLLSNAAKFSPAGAQVTVAVERCAGAVRISVSDHGPGIPPEFQSRIFQKFSQADSSDTRQKGGTGLGLSITKAIVEHMQGRVGFDSSPERGTTFFVELPDQLASEPGVKNRPGFGKIR